MKRDRAIRAYGTTAYIYTVKRKGKKRKWQGETRRGGGIILILSPPPFTRASTDKFTRFFKKEELLFVLLSWCRGLHLNPKISIWNILNHHIVLSHTVKQHLIAEEDAFKGNKNLLRSKIIVATRITIFIWFLFFNVCRCNDMCHWCGRIRPISTQQPTTHETKSPISAIPGTTATTA